MKRRFLTSISLTFLFAASQLLSAQPTPTAVSAFNAYSQAVESRLAQQHSSSATFLSASSDPRLRSGELLIEQLTPTSADLPGALLHHWRGSAFTPGATADDFERLLRDVNAYPEHFAPQVVQAKVVSMSGGNMQATMRTRQHHVLTVVIDATYDVAFGELDAHERYSNSRSTRILEIDSPGTAAERPLHASEEHGYLWRLNTYWSYEERDGGLYLQIEAVSLTRSIPHGLGWAIRPYVETIPRESLEFTLRAACNALRKNSSPTTSPIRMQR